jgi:hypothetical protein
MINVTTMAVIQCISQTILKAHISQLAIAKTLFIYNLGQAVTTSLVSNAFIIADDILK